MSDVLYRVAFYKDREGVVHLRGAVNCTGTNAFAFQLPPGYRPRDGKLQVFITPSDGPDGDDRLRVVGAGISGRPDGAVEVLGPNQVLDGVSFRAEG
jgi:hypothetical protein